MRSNSSLARQKRHKRVRAKAKGYVGGRRTMFRTAVETVRRAEEFATRDRKLRARNFRKLWITRLNAAARERGMRYSELIHGLKKAGIVLNRKMLSEIAIHDSPGFDAIATLAKSS